MRSVNIDVKELVSVLYAAGEITVDDLNEAVNNPQLMNTVVGRAADQHGQFYAIFVATDFDTKVVVRSQDKKRVKLNIRANKRPRVRGEQTYTRQQLEQAVQQPAQQQTRKRKQQDYFQQQLEDIPF